MRKSVSLKTYRKIRDYFEKDHKAHKPSELRNILNIDYLSLLYVLDELVDEGYLKLYEGWYYKGGKDAKRNNRDKTSP